MAEKYAFDTVFDEAGKILSERPKEKKSYLPQEVEAIRQQAFADGRAEAEGEIADALAHLNHQMAQLLGNLIDERTTIRAEAVALASAVSKKLAGSLLDEFSADALMALLEDSISFLRDEARIVVRVSPALTEEIEQRLGGALRQAGFEGQLIVMGDDDLRAADCKVDWAKGGLEHNSEATMAAIDKAVHEFLAAARQIDEMSHNHTVGAGQ